MLELIDDLERLGYARAVGPKRFESFAGTFDALLDHLEAEDGG
jgi:hypothetical protein